MLVQMCTGQQHISFSSPAISLFFVFFVASSLFFSMMDGLCDVTSLSILLHFLLTGLPSAAQKGSRLRLFFILLQSK